MLTRIDPGLSEQAAAASAPRAVVIGAGIGGLSAAMRLGARGYRVIVLDRLESAGGRGSCLWQQGHRFDLGPTIVTVPQVFRELWAACGRDFDAEVDLRPLDPFYEIRWRDGSRFAARQDSEAIKSDGARLSPGDLPGSARFLRDSFKAEPASTGSGIRCRFSCALCSCHMWQGAYGPKRGRRT